MDNEQREAIMYWLGMIELTSAHAAEMARAAMSMTGDGLQAAYNEVAHLALADPTVTWNTRDWLTITSLMDVTTPPLEEMPRDVWLPCVRARADERQTVADSAAALGLTQGDYIRASLLGEFSVPVEMRQFVMKRAAEIGETPGQTFTKMMETALRYL